MTYTEINKRYSELAESSCCLSCGGAINHAGVVPGEVCADFGSGRGTDVIRMAEAAGSEGLAFGIDISEGMISKAVSTAGRLGVDNAKFIFSPLENTGLPENTLDVVISNCTINHAEDKQAVWNEIFRTLKSGGRFVVSDIYSSEPVPVKYRNDPAAVAECWAGAVTRQEYISQVEQAGFKKPEVLEESAPYKKGEIMVSSWTITGRKIN